MLTPACAPSAARVETEAGTASQTRFNARPLDFRPALGWALRRLDATTAGVDEPDEHTRVYDGFTVDDEPLRITATAEDGWDADETIEQTLVVTVRQGRFGDPGFERELLDLLRQRVRVLRERDERD